MSKRALLEALFFFSKDEQREARERIETLLEFIEYPPDSIDTVTLTKDGPL